MGGGIYYAPIVPKEKNLKNLLNERTKKQSCRHEPSANTINLGTKLEQCLLGLGGFLESNMNKHSWIMEIIHVCAFCLCVCVMLVK